MVERQLLIADLKASPTAEPIFTPTSTKQPLIFSHRPEKNETTFENAFTTPWYAFWNVVENQDATFARADFISVHLAPNQEPIAANTRVTLL